MSEESEPTWNKAVLSLDVGTTTVKAIAISKDGRILGKSQEKVNCTESAVLFYKIGKSISPTNLRHKIIKVIIFYMMDEV